LFPGRSTPAIRAMVMPFGCGFQTVLEERGYRLYG
jgi:hypothetical protein